MELATLVVVLSEGKLDEALTRRSEGTLPCEEAKQIIKQLSHPASTT